MPLTPCHWLWNWQICRMCIYWICSAIDIKKITISINNLSHRRELKWDAFIYNQQQWLDEDTSQKRCHMNGIHPHNYYSSLHRWCDSGFNIHLCRLAPSWTAGQPEELSSRCVQTWQMLGERRRLNGTLWSRPSHPCCPFTHTHFWSRRTISMHPRRINMNTQSCTAKCRGRMSSVCACAPFPSFSDVTAPPRG